MSSLVRTLQKRMLKKRGYIRQTQKITIENDRPVIRNLKKGEGDIMGPDGRSTGSTRWPR